MVFISCFANWDGLPTSTIALAFWYTSSGVKPQLECHEIVNFRSDLTLATLRVLGHQPDYFRFSRALCQANNYNGY